MYRCNLLYWFSVYCVCLPMASENIEVKTPRGKVSLVWTYFGYKIDGTTGKVTAGSGAGNKMTCKLCKTDISSCGGTTNLRNHLRAIHPTEYREVLTHESGGVGQPAITMDNFIDKVSGASRGVEKLPHTSVRTKNNR